MKINSSQLATLMVDVANKQFGSEEFNRRELMNATEQTIRQGELWEPDDDLPSGSAGPKSQGLAQIDFRFSDLTRRGALVKTDRNRWRLTIPNNTPDALLKAIISSGFATRAINWAHSENFKKEEVDYKLRLAQNLQQAKISAENNSDWFTAIKKAIQSPENNIVNWRLNQIFLKWCLENKAIARVSLINLWDSSKTIDRRIIEFGKALSDADLKQPGAQLCLISVLLMASDSSNCPPVRSQVLSKVLVDLGLPIKPSSMSVVERYNLFIGILDALIEASQKTTDPLTSRLAAQGAIWCAVGGWKAAVTPTEPRIVADVDENAEKEIAEAESELAPLNPTVRAATIAARRGQGKYRSDLLGLWSGCSVTACVVEEMLRASHLKPWRDSSNTEKLDRYNGLLLTPTLDQALDRCIISFKDDGEILISHALNKQDALILGVTKNLRLRFIRPQHLPYLGYHRKLFEAREAKISPPNEEK